MSNFQIILLFLLAFLGVGLLTAVGLACYIIGNRAGYTEGVLNGGVVGNTTPLSPSPRRFKMNRIMNLDPVSPGEGDDE